MSERSLMDSGLCCMARHANAIPPWTCDCPCHKQLSESIDEIIKTRAKYEQAMIGKTIKAVVWSNQVLFRAGDVDANQIAGFELDDDTTVYFTASGQIDVDRVWVDIEGIE